ncbi:hypothetical protein BIW11_12282 [Tropilaelaps mercedesae]|uniref:Uncharacterized protein n=1 Tax=Tropilaelaps mercedesae TaxID=418985 RepID=A0A1V9X7Y9_9ACAR|nr:hypothetical protein BIW11_12282 [Tropilaelaps mercedesae]
MKQVFFYAAMFYLVSGQVALMDDRMDVSKFGQIQNPPLTFDRFLRITGNENISQLRPAALMKLTERYRVAKTRIERIRQNSNSTFAADFMPFDSWSDDEKKRLFGFVAPPEEIRNKPLRMVPI